MNIIDFVNKWCGKKCDYDGHYGAQCVDLFRQYCKDVLEIPHTGAVEGAKDIAEKYESMPIEKKYFALVKASQYMKEGDVAVWGKSDTNKYGHVAIVIHQYANGDLLVFEQDGFKQDGAKLAIRKTGERFLGYLRTWTEMEA